MQKLLTRALAVAVVLLLAPLSAHASSPWGWLDKLSGGPLRRERSVVPPDPITTTRPRPGNHKASSASATASTSDDCRVRDGAI